MYPSWLYPGSDQSADAVLPEVPGVHVRRILSWYNPLSWLSAGLRLRGDVVHAQWWSWILAPIYATVLSVARLRGKRVLLTVHNVAPHEGGRLRSLLNRLVLRFGDRFVVHSPRNVEALQGLVRRPIDVIGHGLLRAPKRGLTVREARASLGLAANAKVVLAFGNIRPYKGLDVLIRAFDRVRALVPSAVLLVGGQPWGSARPYEQLVNEMGLTDSVRLHLGYIPESQIETFFVASDVVALPYTRFDGASGVGSLVLPFGQPLVVSDVGGLTDLVDCPEAVVPPGDPESLANTLVRVLTDDALRARFAAGSRRRARDFEWGPIAEETARLYRELALR